MSDGDLLSTLGPVLIDQDYWLEHHDNGRQAGKRKIWLIKIFNIITIQNDTA